MYNDEVSVRSLPLRGLCALEVLDQCNGRQGEAAGRLDISLPGLSLQLSRLRADLGFSVIRHAGYRQGFILTAEGLKLVHALRAAMPALENLAEAVKSCKTESRAVKVSTDERELRRCE
jgi:DNA-binding transcriptional LysR family regulator